MDTRINHIRYKIETLRRNMLRAESVMREQINRDEDCAVIAEELLHMRAVMSAMTHEREALGDREPIRVDSFISRGARQQNSQAHRRRLRRIGT